MRELDHLSLSPEEFDERFPDEKPAEMPKKRRLRPILTMADEVRSRDVEFLWEGRFSYQTGIIAGTQGLGKSMFTAFLAALLTRDDVQEWPDGTPCPTGSVLWFSPEGGAALTVRRLRAMGADLSRIAFYGGLTDGRLDEYGEPILKGDPELTQVQHIQEAIDKLAESSGVPVRLAVCDPVADFMGACDQYVAGEVSSVLKKTG